MKAYTPLIRIISVDHNLTLTAEEILKAAMAKHNITTPLKNVFCHLEASRCGVASGKVAIEVEGSVVWMGKAVTPQLANDFCESLVAFIEKKSREYGAQ